MSCKIYLVGTQASLKTNSWEAMTNSAAEAARLQVENNWDTVKAVSVQPPRSRK